MTEHLPARPEDDLLPLLPPALAGLGRDGATAFRDYFTAQIRNKNTRLAYGRAVWRFCAWLEENYGGVDLRNMQTIHVSEFIEWMDTRGSKSIDKAYAAPTVKQHLAAIRMLCGFLVVRQVLPINPALDVRGPKHVVTKGKTPHLTAEDARALFNSIDAGTVIGLRDRALLGLMVYSFARIGAALSMDVEDYYQAGRRMMFRLNEKGGKEHTMPAHHTAIEYMDAYLARLGEREGPLFRSINRNRDGYTERRLDRREALAMVKRRTRAAGLSSKDGKNNFSNHTFRATGITAYLKNGGLLEHAQTMAAHSSPTTTRLYDHNKDEVTLDEVERIIL